MDNSKFNLWRATFSFCFVDGFLDPKEQAWVEEKLKSLPFTKEEASTLLKDFNSPPAIDELLPLITKPADRGFLLNHIRLLAHIDNHLSQSEKDKITAVQLAVMSHIDMPGLNEQLAKDESDSQGVHNKKSYFESIIKDLMKRNK